MAAAWESAPIVGAPKSRAAWEDAPEIGAAPQAGQQTSPTDGNSFLQNAAAGLGKGFTDLALGAKQRLDEGATYLENKFGGQNINKALGLKNAADIQRETQAQVDEKRRIDAPLMTTGGGKVGNIAGKAAVAIPAAFIPGGQTLAGSVLTGATLGGVDATATGESAGKNALLGAAGGGLGYGVGKGIGYAANKLTQSGAAEATKNTARDAIAQTSRQAGYVIPPVQTNPSMLNRGLEGLAGKLSTGQSASIKNQKVTNELAAKALGIDASQPITKETLSGIRAAAGEAYDAVKSAGTIQADKPYAAALQGITQKYQGASKDFPELAKNEIDDIVSSVNKPNFEADSAIDAIKILRERASSAYGKGDKTMGRAYREASDAMEGLIERNLQASGQPGLLKSFQDARQLIAKTYSVENALNSTTGNVAAKKLATQLGKGKPLSKELKEIAKFAQAFPKAADEVTSSIPGISPLDFYGAGGLSAATGNPLAMLTIGARPVARTAILSKPYQNSLAAPSYSGNQLLNLLATNPSRISLQTAGVTGLPQAAQK